MSAPLFLLDTSFFVGREQGRITGQDIDVAGSGAVAVVTLAELHLGVLMAKDATSRAQRLFTLVQAQAFQALPADANAAERFAGLVAYSREQGRSLKVQDAWIAAIAAANGATIVTQDNDFDGLPVDVLKV